jgi:hypothetical protein
MKTPKPTQKCVVNITPQVFHQLLNPQQARLERRTHDGKVRDKKRKAK